MDTENLNKLQAGTLIFTVGRSTASKLIKTAQHIHKFKTEKKDYSCEDDINTKYSHVMVCLGNGKVIEATGSKSIISINKKEVTLQSGINIRPIEHALHDVRLATAVVQKKNELLNSATKKAFDAAAQKYNGNKYGTWHFILSMFSLVLFFLSIIFTGYCFYSIFQAAYEAYNLGMDKVDWFVESLKVCLVLFFLLISGRVIYVYRKNISGWTMVDNEEAVDKFFQVFQIGKFNLKGSRFHKYLLSIEKNAICSGVAHQFIQIIDPDFSSEIKKIKATVSPAILIREIRKSDKFSYYDLSL